MRRVDTVKDEYLDKLRRAGIRWLCLGIESASAHVRNGANEQYGAHDIRAAVCHIQSAGIHVLGNFMFGLPDDNHERVQATLDLAQELNCEFAYFYSAMAYPGSFLYTLALAQGRALPANWHQYSQHAYDTLPLSNEQLTAAEILAFRDMAIDRYFTSPSYLNMISRKFGPKVCDHVIRMTKHKLGRQSLEDKNAA